MSDKEDRLRKMTQKSLQLFDKLQKVQQEEGDEMTDRHIELVEEMFELIARLEECPDHGAPEAGTLEVNLSRKNGKFIFTVEGLCCDEMDDRVERRLREFVEQLMDRPSE